METSAMSGKGPHLGQPSTWCIGW